MSDRKTDTRRGFLLGTTAAAGAAAVAAATVTRAPATKVGQAEGAAADDKAKKGYHLTEHVRRYYRTTLI